MKGILPNMARISNNLFNAFEEFKKFGDVRKIGKIVKIIHPGFFGDDEARRLVFMNEICQSMKIKVWYELMVDGAKSIEGINELIKRAYLHFVNCRCCEGRIEHTIFYPVEIGKLCLYTQSLFDDNVCEEMNGRVYVSLRHREELENKKYLDENSETANIKHLLAFAGKYPGFQRYFELFSVRHEKVIAKLIGTSDRGLQIFPIFQWPLSLFWNYENKIMIVTKDCPEGDNVVIVK